MSDRWSWIISWKIILFSISCPSKLSMTSDIEFIAEICIFNVTYTKMDWTIEVWICKVDRLTD